MGAIPKPIEKYLQIYPEFKKPDDIRHGFARTSRESFPYAAKLVYDSLVSGEEVWATDNISPKSDFITYWMEDGLPHLRANYEANGRGVTVNRVFVVLESEYSRHHKAFAELLALHSAAGVNAYLAINERLPNDCRYDFAIWGCHLVDEVIYAMGSNVIVDNQIHWSTEKVSEFRRKISIIQEFVEPDQIASAHRAPNFEEVQRRAQALRSNLDSEKRRRNTRLTARPQKSSPRGAVRILLLSANPPETGEPLRIDEEYREIDCAIRESKFRNRVLLEKHLATRVSDIQRLLLRNRPHIVHFSGHGRAVKGLVFEDASGKPKLLASRALGKLFSAFSDEVKCVVLNACFSEEQAKSIVRHIPCVIGMSRDIDDRAAIGFSDAFYTAIAYGKSISVAFDLGCARIDMESLDGHDTPKLLTRTKESANIRLI